MTTPEVIDQGRVRLRPARRATVLLAVAVARVLATRPPNQLRGAMTVLAKGAVPAGAAQAERARRDVVSASYACASPEGCLPRSIATALVCRLAGRWPAWCVGVRAVPPFGAHAWVEADGRQVGEPYPEGYHRELFGVRR